MMKTLLIYTVILSTVTLVVPCFAQMMGMGTGRMGQEQQSQMSEMGGKLGLNLGLGLSGGTYGGSSQMGNGRKNRMPLMKRSSGDRAGCYGRRGPPTTTTTTTTTTAAST
ncbi:hypothetical protein JTB14_022212 [Gonioctena quinquepunctata]|nr:hypothetical protein JTB14_022212 [Gonioctena quinquepunctata]